MGATLLAIHAAIVVLCFYFGPRPCPVFPYLVVRWYWCGAGISSAGVYVGRCGKNEEDENGQQG